jgi:hypothetical protein
VHVEYHDTFLVGLEGSGDTRICKSSETTDHCAGTGRHGSEEAAASESVSGCIAGVVK